MATGSKLCPHCGRLNVETASRCAHCQQPLPSAWELSLRRVSGRALGGAAATAFFAILSVAVYLALAGEGGGLGAVSGRRALAWGALLGGRGWSEPWRHLSAIFVHLNLLHIGFNVLALVSFGRALEQVLGSARFSVLLLVTGAAGFVASDVWYGWSGARPVTGGLSGGIFGLLGAEVGLRLAAADPAWKKAAVSALGYALAMALLPGLNVNNAAHLGGLAMGGALGWALSRAASRRGFDLPFRLLAGALLLATLASIAHARFG